MSNLITINASKARNDFFKILERVFLENKVFLVKKAGVPVAEISKPRSAKRKAEENIDIMKFAGMWKDIDAEKIKRYIYEGRKDRGEIKRRLPKF